METIKGLITLLLVSVAVFTAVVIFNDRTEPGYEAAMKKATLANTDKPLKQNAIGKASGVDTHQKNQKTSL